MVLKIVINICVVKNVLGYFIQVLIYKRILFYMRENILEYVV